MYLLDTCVISELVKLRPSSKVIQWIGSQSESDLFMSVLTVGEIEEGIAALASGAKKDVLFTWVRHTLSERFTDRLLTVDRTVATAWGEFQGRTKQTLPIIDGLIAATARVLGLTVVTRNVADFRRFDVPVFDPWK